jgi:repressor of nif and glnA expression
MKIETKMKAVPIFKIGDVVQFDESMMEEFKEELKNSQTSVKQINYFMLNFMNEPGKVVNIVDRGEGNRITVSLCGWHLVIPEKYLKFVTA